MTPMEYGVRVQDALRMLIEDRFGERNSPVRSRAALSKALGHGDARQYVASRFKAQGKDGKIRDLTVPDLLAFARAIGLNAHDLLVRAQAMVDEAGATIHNFPVPSDPDGTLAEAAEDFDGEDFTERYEEPDDA